MLTCNQSGRYPHFSLQIRVNSSLSLPPVVSLPISVERWDLIHARVLAIVVVVAVFRVCGSNIGSVLFLGGML